MTTSTHMNSRLHVRGLDVHRGSRILSDISFDVAPAEIVAVVGPSGCGKTTLLHTLAGIEAARGGSIIVDGSDITTLPAGKRPTGLLFQTPSLFNHMNVHENIAFALESTDVPPAQRESLIDSIMVRMGIVGLASRYPYQLSGGQAQRVALARTLVRRPSVLLLDEPLAHVGASVASTIRASLIREVRRLGSAVLYVTHDVTEACLVADRIMLLDLGRCLQIDTARMLYAQPSSIEVAHLMGIPNIVSGTVESVNEAPASSLLLATVTCGTVTYSIPAPHGTKPGDVQISIPPENIHLTPSAPYSVIGRHGQIISASFVRSHMSYDVETEIGTLVVHTPDTSTPFEVGALVEFDVTSGWVLPSSDTDNEVA